MSELDAVRDSAFQEADAGDEFAVCCSDGDVVFAATRDEAETEYDDMKNLRDSLNPFVEYNYEIVDLSESNGSDQQAEDESTESVTEPELTAEDQEEGSRRGSAAGLMKGSPDTSRTAPSSSDVDWRSYFPYDEPREAQVDGIEKVIENASEGGYTMLEGACGTGKTLVGLDAGLRHVRDPDSPYQRLVCLTPVKQQIIAFEDDLRAINENLREQAAESSDDEYTPEPVSGITLVGKSDVCSYTDSGKIDPRAIYGRCEDLREPVRRTAMYADDSKSALRQLANNAALDPNSDQEPVQTDQWEAPYAQGFPQTDENAACVVCGAPIQDTRGLLPEAIKTAYRLEFGNDYGFDYAFTVPAVRKARQALGRVIRDHEETGVRVAVDRRYASNSHDDDVRKYFPEYEQNDYEPTSPEPLRMNLGTFWMDA